MTIFVFSLVVVSAAIHVMWNALVKSAADKASFAWLTSMLGPLVLLPVFVGSRVVCPGPLSGEVWGWALFSGLFEALYVIFLFNAYGRADLSVVYPLSRGIAPLVTLVLGGMVASDSVSLSHGLSVAVIFAGVLTVCFSTRKESANHGLDRAGILFSLCTGGMIAGYHLVDRRAMLLAVPPNPVEYLFLMHLFLALFVTLWVWPRQKKRGTLLSEWHGNRKGVLTVGVFAPLAYLLIIVALKYGNVTHVAAGRNIGIFLSTLVGALVLKEEISGKRMAGALVIAMGVIGLVLTGGQA